MRWGRRRIGERCTSGKKGRRGSTWDSPFWKQGHFQDGTSSSGRITCCYSLCTVSSKKKFNLSVTEERLRWWKSKTQKSGPIEYHLKRRCHTLLRSWKKIRVHKSHPHEHIFRTCLQTKRFVSFTNVLIVWFNSHDSYDFHSWFIRFPLRTLWTWRPTRWVSDLTWFIFH